MSRLRVTGLTMPRPDEPRLSPRPPGFANMAILHLLLLHGQRCRRNKARDDGIHELGVAAIGARNRNKRIDRATNHKAISRVDNWGDDVGAGSPRRIGVLAH